MPHAPSRRVAGAALLCGMLSCAALAAQAQVFKWVDEKGRTHYGEKPPEGVKSSEVARPVPPSDPAKAAAPDDWRKKALDAKRDKVQREQEAEAASRREANDRVQAERRCRNARITLDRLDNVHNLYKYNDKGERVYLTDAEREPEKARARREVQEHCRD